MVKSATEEENNVKSCLECNKVELLAASNMKLEMQQLEEENAEALKKYHKCVQERQQLETTFQKELENTA
eukprot:scaffold94892_cov35-Attheya_sp.AAC.1